MREITLHHNSECYVCKEWLGKDTVVHGSYSPYLKKLIVYCSDCYKKRIQEELKKQLVGNNKHSKLSRLTDSVFNDFNQKRLVDYFAS